MNKNIELIKAYMSYNSFSPTDFARLVSCKFGTSIDREDIEDIISGSYGLKGELCSRYINDDKKSLFWLSRIR